MVHDLEVPRVAVVVLDQDFFFGQKEVIHALVVLSCPGLDVSKVAELSLFSLAVLLLNLFQHLHGLRLVRLLRL